MKNGIGKLKSGRRNFLLAVGAGGAVTVAAVVNKTVGTTAPKTNSDKRGGQGYQLTDHVRTYYRTTKI